MFTKQRNEKYQFMDTQLIRNARVICLLMFVYASAAALAAPATLTQSVTYFGQTYTMQLTRQDLRGQWFELWVQQSDGSYEVVTPVEERSYIGTVDGYPDAISCGILKDDGTIVFGTIIALFFRS